MTTPVIMLVLLFGPYVAIGGLERPLGREILDPTIRGCLGITLVFLFTGAGHFIQSEPMATMMPPGTPFVMPLIYLTGVIEIVAAIAVLLPRIRRVVGWALIAMLIGFLPVNVYAAVNRVGMGGHLWGPVYLLIRVPLQVVLGWWVWRFALRSPVSN